MSYGRYQDNDEERLHELRQYWDKAAASLLPSSVTAVAVQNLSHQPDYWGKPVTDERYAIIADRGRQIGGR